MRTLLLLFFLASCGPVAMHSATALPITPQAEVMRGKMLEKAIMKRLFKPKALRQLAESIAATDQEMFHDGTMEGLVGILLVGMNIGLWFWNPFWAIIATLPLAVAGSILGVTGFIKGLRHKSLRGMILSIIAVLLNLALVIAFVALFTGAS